MTDPQDFRREVRDKLSVARLTRQPNVVQQCEDFLTDLLAAQAAQIAQLQQGGILCVECQRRFFCNRCPDCAREYRDARADDFKAEAAQWRERALKAEARRLQVGNDE